MTTQLYGLDVPDEMDELNLKDAEPKELFKIMFAAFRSATEDLALDELDALYERACRITRPHADRLIETLGKMDIPCCKHRAGMFISSIINQSDRKEMIWEHETDIGNIAYRLPADKIFVNRGKTGSWFGSCAEGTIINYGKAGDYMGEFSEGLIINCGETGYSAGAKANTIINYGKTGKGFGDAANCLVANLGEADRFLGACAKGMIINYGEPDPSMGHLAEGNVVYQYVAELAGYFSGLKAILDEGKKDYHALSKLPSGQKIRDDVESILKARGYLK